ncbi:MAG: hypothetical protein AAF618_11660 [Pseudomonadota bacterium]
MRGVTKRNAQGRATIDVLPRLILRNEACDVGGRSFGIKAGAWAFYVPRLRLKLLHAVDGLQHCLHGSAPTREEVLTGEGFPTSKAYSPADWKAAFETPVLTRTAENIVCAEKLHRAGLGPAVRGYCVVLDFAPWYAAPSITAGYYVENLKLKLPKTPATEHDLTRAGVLPDRIKSCLRQQIRGYVSDLNSVVGVMPIDADEEVAELRAALEMAASRGA